jgi:hypothetical protein
MDRRIIVLPFVIFVLLAPLTAQTSSQSSTSDPALLVRADSQQRSQWAREWLSSADPRHVAWGAWLTKQDNLRDLIPELIRQVREYTPVSQPSSQADRDRRDSLVVVLDTLITLRAAVPAEDIRKLIPSIPLKP